jgi:hypothetical protein
MTRSLSLVVGLVLAGPAAAAEPVDYLQSVKPVLAARCFACHGALQQKAGLRLDTVAFMKEGGVLVPGKSSASLIVDHVLARNGARQMPPPSDGEPLRPQEIAQLQAWIDQGAAFPPDEQPEADPKEHWAFRPPVRPAVPAAPDAGGNPIDAFLAAEWARHALRPQPAADRRSWLRRVYLDLIGLPPTSADQEAFLADTATDAYERVVERLLASPQHGERWGRHFMDIWRYSDWWGLGAEVRNSQKHIWHWRDWIVESLNADKGYDQMVREMLAADELYPDDLDRLRATGYLARHYFRFNRTTWLDGVLEHTAKGFLGLTLNCAKCHDHKYDPITQQDYYRLRAFFEPYQVRLDQLPGEADLEKDGLPRVFDCNLEAPTYLHIRGDDRRPRDDRPLSPGLPPLLTFGPLTIEPVPLPAEAHTPGLRPFVLAGLLATAEQQIAAAQAAVARARSAAGDDAATQAAVTVAEKALATALAQPKALQARAAADRARAEQRPDAAELARHAAAAERTAAVLKAEEDLARAELEQVKADDKARAAADKKVATARAAVEQARKALANPGDSYTPIRGARKTPESPTETEAERLRPFPTISTGRRTALAAWLTDRRNPLLARVVVNHVWLRHFGQPLVPTVFDFGRKGQPPTHPALLDWLAVELMDHDWSLRHLHRLMTTSRAYRMTSSPIGAAARNLSVDPENRWYWRMNPVRMEAQVVRDSLLHLAGELDLKMGGPSVPVSDEGSRRRSLYYVHSHNDHQKFLSMFDDANVLECYRRDTSIVPQQALALSNSALAQSAAAKIAARIDRPGVGDADFIRAAFALVLGCDPNAEEQAECAKALVEWSDLLTRNRVPNAAARARADLVQALLNHNDFVTVR